VLARWRVAAPELEGMIPETPALQEAQPLATRLGALADLGLDALGRLTSTGPAAAAAWRDQSLEALRAAAAPQAQLEFPPLLLGALREMVVGAAARTVLARTLPAECTRQVRARAAAAAPKEPQ